MKKKMLFLLISISISITAACSNGGEPAGGEEKPPFETGGEELPGLFAEESYYDKLGERDFSGDTFTILSGTGIFFYNQSEEFTGDPINDAVIMRNKLIEEKYNIKIEYIDRDDVGTALKGSVAAGEYWADMMISSIIAMSGYAQNNLLYNVAAMPYLSLDSPWWSKLIYDNMTFDGKLYYTTGDISPGMYQAPAAMYVNHSLLQDYGIADNLYELVYSGKWTFDVVERICKDMDTDLNQDGKMHADDDFYGFIQQDNTLTSNTFCAGLGIKLSAIKENTIEVDLISPNSIEKIDKLAGFLKKASYNQQNDIITKTFHDGRAVFLTHYLESALLYLRTMENDYGILPLPKYDEAQESYISSLNPWNPSSVGVPMIVDPEKAGFLLEAMAYASYELIRPNVYELVLKTKFARDTESAGIVDLIIETSYLDLNSVYNFGGSTDIVRNAIFDKKPLVSAYEKAAAKIEKAVSQYIEALNGE